MPGGHKRFMLNKLGGGGGDRIDPRHAVIYDFYGIFSVCAPPPILGGAYYSQPQTHVPYFLLNDLLCNSKCSVTGGA